MKVFVVHMADFEDQSAMAVFSTEELADAFMAKIIETATYDYQKRIDVTEFEIDEFAGSKFKDYE